MILIFLAGLSSCEEVVTDVELPYEEKIVVDGMIIAGERIAVRITRTVPPLEEPTEENTYIEVDSAYITADGEKHHLIITGSFYVNELEPEAGKEYELDVFWNGLHARAKTFIPQKADIDTVTERKDHSGGDQTNLYAEFRPQMNCVYQAGWRNGYHGNQGFITSGPYELADTSGSGKLRMYFGHYYDYMEEKQVRGFIAAYDKAFGEYYRTRPGDFDSGLIGFQGGSTIWNVEGDGIGIFIGVNVKDFEYVKE